MKRWKLSFAFGRGQRNPPKIFFDFTRDTLFFGDEFRNNFYSLLGFEENVNVKDRKALRKVAFNEDLRYRRDFFVSSHGLARRLHKGFPALTNFIFVVKRKVIWNNAYRRIAYEDLPSSEKRIITFFRENGTNTTFARNFVEEFRRHEWEQPQIDYVSYYRTIPGTVQLFQDEDWKDFELRMRKIEDEGLSGPPPFLKSGLDCS